nr:reverse transcriptase domain-containing protein [Tanacetum cinerariifolium]
TGKHTGKCPKKNNPQGHLFKIDLMLIELGTFDVIIGMDWLVEQDAIIMCGKKRFYELVFLCPEAVPTEKKKKVEAYIKGLPEIIKGETTSPRQKGFPRETKENGKIRKVAIGTTTTTTEETIKATTATNNTITRGKEMHEH